jgi:hypothetical protein
MNHKQNYQYTMKRLIHLSVFILAANASALAQSTVDWGSIPFIAMTAQTNGIQSSPFVGYVGPGGGGQGPIASATSSERFYFALLYQAFNGFQANQPVTVAALDTWQFTGLMATNSNIAGRLVPIAPNFAAPVPWPAGVTNNIMMVGWSANLGSSWATVSNVLNNWPAMQNNVVGDAYFGTSATGYIAPHDNISPGASVFGSGATADGLPIYSLNTQLYFITVPEPGTLALAGLGSLFLIALRCKKFWR